MRMRHLAQREVEAVVERRGVVEDVRVQHAQHGPELMQVVLQRRASQQQRVHGVHLGHHAVDLRDLAFQHVRLVHNKVPCAAHAGGTQAARVTGEQCFVWPSRSRDAPHGPCITYRSE